MNLQTKIMLLTCSAVLIVGITIGAFFSITSTNLITESLGTQAKKLSELAAQQIEMGSFCKVLGEIIPDPNNKSNQQRITALAEYNQIREKLLLIKKYTGLKYLYTMAKLKDGKYIYVVDGEQLKDEDICLPGAVEAEVHTDLINVFKTQQIQVGALTYDKKWGGLLTSFVPLFDKDHQMVGTIGADFDATQIYLLINRNQKIGIWVLCVGLLITILGGFLISRMIVKPLQSLTINVGKVQEGDLTVSFAAKGKDEIARLNHAFQEMVTNLGTMVRAVKATGEKVAAFSGELLKYAQQSVESNQQMVTATQDVSSNAVALVQGSAASATVIAEVAKSIQSIAATANLLREKSAANAADALEGNQITGTAVSQINIIHETVADSTRVIRFLYDRAQEIDKMLSLITEISSQTSLLAFNARIEAARQGENGKGFSVLADRVKLLAQETEDMAKQIQAIIQEILEYSEKSNQAITAVAQQVEKGIGLTKQAGMNFSQIVSASGALTEQITGISGATEAISADTEEITATVEDMSLAIRNTAAIFKEIEQNIAGQFAVMQQLTGEAGALNQMAQELDGLIKRFAV